MLSPAIALGYDSDGFMLDNYYIPEDIYQGVTVIGLGAVIANGLSYQPIAGNLTILCKSRKLDGFFSGLYLYRYIKDYNTDVGFENGVGVPTPERAICDCILYDEWNLYLYEALTFYIQDDSLYNKRDLINTAVSLGISKERIEEEISDVLEMEF